MCLHCADKGQSQDWTGLSQPPASLTLASPLSFSGKSLSGEMQGPGGAQGEQWGFSGVSAEAPPTPLEK